jgi:hypothetical protein
MTLKDALMQINLSGIPISSGEEMTLEKALKRIEFLEKALDGAIDLAKIEQARGINGNKQEALCTSHYYESCDFTDEPELTAYLEEKK